MRLSQYPINTMKETPRKAEVVSHSADAAGRAHPAPGAACTAGCRWDCGAAEGGTHHPRGNEPCRSSGVVDAWWCSGGAVAGVGPWTVYGAGAAAHQRTGTSATSWPTYPRRGESPTSRGAQLQSYRQLPVNFYQIQTEVPRRGAAALRRHAGTRIHHEGCVFLSSRRGVAPGGLPRCTTPTRESSHAPTDLRAVRADSGAIGGDVSQEFHVLADSGEDAIVFSDADDYAGQPGRRRPAHPRRSAPRRSRRCARCRLPVCAPSPSSRASCRWTPARCVRPSLSRGRGAGRGPGAAR